MPRNMLSLKAITALLALVPAVPAFAADLAVVAPPPVPAAVEDDGIHIFGDDLDEVAEEADDGPDIDVDVALFDDDEEDAGEEPTLPLISK